MILVLVNSVSIYNSQIIVSLKQVETYSFGYSYKAQRFVPTTHSYIPSKILYSGWKNNICNKDIPLPGVVTFICLHIYNHKPKWYK